MNKVSDWESAAKSFAEHAKEHQNRVVLCQICRFIAESHHNSYLNIKHLSIPNEIEISHTSTKHSSKFLRFKAIQGEKVEMSLFDEKTGAERCFFPHTPANSAFERAKEILNNLSWDDEVKQYKNSLEWIRGVFGGNTSNH